MKTTQYKKEATLHRTPLQQHLWQQAHTHKCMLDSTAGIQCTAQSFLRGMLCLEACAILQDQSSKHSSIDMQPTAHLQTLLMHSYSSSTQALVHLAAKLSQNELSDETY